MGDAKEHRSQAERYRRLKADISDPRTLEALTHMAAEADRKADVAEAKDRDRSKGQSWQKPFKID